MKHVCGWFGIKFEVVEIHVSCWFKFLETFSTWGHWPWSAHNN